MNWERVRLGDVLEYEQPTNYIVSSEDYDNSFEIPVLTAGKSFILGYTNEKENIYTNVPIIIFDDFTTAAKYVDFPFKVKSSAMKILKALENKADIKYLYYKMQTINFDATEHKRYWISKYSQIEIPLPPLSVQKEIVEKLDKAAAIREKSKALLSHYDALAESLFIELFGDPISNEKGWEKKKLGEVVTNLNNMRVPLKSSDRQMLENKYPYYGASGIIDYVDDFIYEGDNLLIGEDGANLLSRSTPIAFIAKGKYWVNNHAHVNGYNGKANLLYLCFFINMIDLSPYVTGSAQPKLNRGNLDNIEIPLPPLSLQIKFAEMVENIERQKARAKAEIEQGEAVFQALLQESFG